MPLAPGEDREVGQRCRVVPIVDQQLLPGSPGGSEVAALPVDFGDECQRLYRFRIDSNGAVRLGQGLGQVSPGQGDLGQSGNREVPVRENRIRLEQLLRRAVQVPSLEQVVSEVVLDPRASRRDTNRVAIESEIVPPSEGPAGSTRRRAPSRSAPRRRKPIRRFRDATRSHASPAEQAEARHGQVEQALPHDRADGEHEVGDRQERHTPSAAIARAVRRERKAKKTTATTAAAVTPQVASAPGAVAETKGRTWA